MEEHLSINCWIFYCPLCKSEYNTQLGEDTTTDLLIEIEWKKEMKRQEERNGG